MFIGIDVFFVLFLTSITGSGAIRGLVEEFLLFRFLLERNAQRLPHHAFDAVGKVGRFGQLEAGSEGGRVEHQHRHILRHDILCVRVDAAQQLAHQRMPRVDLERLLLVQVVHALRIVRLLVSVGERQSLHVAGPAEHRSNQCAGRVGEPLGQLRLRDLVLEGHIVQPLQQRLVLRLQLLEAGLRFVRFVQREALLGDVLEPLAIELGQRRDTVLIDCFDQEQHLVTTRQQPLDEGRLFDLATARTGNEVDVVLLRLHALHILRQARVLLVLRRGRLEAQQLGQPGPIARVLHDAELNVGRVLLPELLVLLLVDLLQHIERLPDQLLLDHLDELVLLERLTRHVQWQIVRIDDTADEAQIVGHHVVELVRNEHTAHVQLDVVRLRAVLVEALRWLHLRHIQQRLERDLALGNEVRLRQRIGRVLGEALVELVVLLRRDLADLARPDRFAVVHDLPVPDRLLDLLRLRFAVLIGRLLFLHLHVLLLVIGVVLLGRFLGRGRRFLLDRYLLFDLLARPHVDREVDELRVLLDQLLHRVLLQEVECLLLEVQRNLGTALQRVTARILHDAEAGGIRLPDVLLVVVVLRRDHDAIGHQERRVETDTELADHVVHVLALRLRVLHLGEEIGRTGFGDRTEVVDEILLRHTDTGIDDVQHLALLVRLYLHLQVAVAVQYARFRERQ
uniref:Secreted protein n=1 Tax=Anopheles triannulatus TaxID=58253 RepID=A0A2M3ZY44_9DIPT